MWALTSWIDADPEARTWLDGYPDPWGMKVNENYRGIDLPVDNWPLLDDFVAPENYQQPERLLRQQPHSRSCSSIANPSSSIGAVDAQHAVRQLDGADRLQVRRH